MTEEQIPIKISIPVEDETPFIPEQKGHKVKETIAKASQQVGRASGNTAKKVWRSDARKKAARALGKGGRAVAAKGGRLVQDQVVRRAERRASEKASDLQERIRATDWKLEARKGTSNGLRWLSRRLSRLAGRLLPAASDPDGASTEP